MKSSRLSNIVPMVTILIVVMLIIPLPSILLDLLLAANLSMAVLILLTALTMKRTLDFSVFPALLLITTLFRLALNVSSTRLILLHGSAGKVIHAFGQTVVGGNLIVGLVVFLILVVIQFIVITAGAGRVAEVAARFTLDAMPGKQMAIDADLNSGLIDDEGAKKRRREVSQEAEFYGAMDGASKFVKGDAIAGIVIVSINLVGGILIGVLQHGVAITEALSKYSLLSVGDGLVSQLPALLISVASGIVVTSVQGENGDGLGGEVLLQLRNRQPLRLAACALAGLALMPGMPKLPFLVLAAGLWFAGRKQPSVPVVAAPNLAPEADPDDPQALLEGARVEPLELELSMDLLDLIDPSRGGVLIERAKALRRRVAMELGVVLPAIRCIDNTALPSSTYRICVHGVELARGEAPLGCSMVLGDAAEHLPGTPALDPVFGLPARWIRTELADSLALEGATVVDRASVIVTHLNEAVKHSAAELLSRQDVATLVEAVKQAHPALGEELGEGKLSLAELQQVLQGLLAEGVGIRDLARIIEAVTAKAKLTRQPEALIEAARTSIGPLITQSAASSGTLAALTFEPGLEQSLLESVRTGEQGSWLALDPTRIERLLQGVATAVHAAEEEGWQPAVVCSGPLRPAVQKLVRTARPELRVLAYHELSRTTQLEAVGTITLSPEVSYA